MSQELWTWAHAVAEEQLALSLPQRWAHSQGVARRAAGLASMVGSDGVLLASAAVLHDVGYAPRLVVTGFHPLDGARYLRDVHHADDRLVRLVANHSFALLEAEERGLREVLQTDFPPLEDQHTLTFFPQFLAVLREQASRGATVVVVGASDGKFVLPLAAAGYHVVAVERDSLALHGGEVCLPGGVTSYAMGLIDRLKREDLQDRVQVVERDFLGPEPLDTQCDAVWTSCSWHYSVNHRRPLAEFVARMQVLVRATGLFGAEFMMPAEQDQHRIEHYTSPERLSRHFADEWTILLTLRTGEFTERAHVGQLHDHTHRMGLLLASRVPEYIRATGE